MENRISKLIIFDNKDRENKKTRKHSTDDEIDKRLLKRALERQGYSQSSDKLLSPEDKKLAFIDAYKRNDSDAIRGICEDQEISFDCYINNYITKKKQENLKYKTILKYGRIAKITSVEQSIVGKILRNQTRASRKRLIFVLTAMSMSIDEINECLKLYSYPQLQDYGMDLGLKILMDIENDMEKIIIFLQRSFPDEKDK